MTTERNNQICIDNFNKFYDLLMKDAPQGYKPWFFPCKKNDKGPDGDAILKIDATSKKSWHHHSARLNKEQVIKHLEMGYNIGLSARKGDPLIIIDIDDEQYINQMPDTLTNTSRKRVGIHGFCWDKDGTAKINLPTGDSGEIRSDNQYVIVSGFAPFDLTKEKDKKVYDNLSEKTRNDPLLGYYTLRDAKPLKTITFDDLPQIFKDKDKDNKEKEAEIKQVDEFKNEKRNPGKYDDLFKLKVADIVGLIPASKRVSHPLHESDTDSNFSLSRDGSLAHCWRHLVSLNAVQYLCVDGGYCSCEYAGTPHKGRGLSKIKGDKKALAFAYNRAVKRGLIKNNIPTEQKQTTPKADEWKIEIGSEVINRDFGEEKYLVDKVIPVDTIVFVAGNPGDFKSWWALNTGMCISAGRKLLDMYSTEKAGVLLIDEENGLKRTARRMKKISVGMDLKPEELKNLYLCSYNDIKLNFKERWVSGENQETIDRLTKIIKEKNIKLVILDSMVRMMEGEENNSSDVRTCFTTLKKIMVNCPDISFLIVHHTTKAGGNKLRDMRGSGDFGAMAGVVYMFRAYNNKVFVDITKHRDLDKDSFPLMDFGVEDILDNHEERIGIAFNHLTREAKDTASIELLERIRELLDNKQWKKFRHKDMIAEFGDEYSKKTLSDALSSGINREYWVYANGKDGRKGYKVENVKLPVEMEKIEVEEVEDV